MPLPNIPIMKIELEKLKELQVIDEERFRLMDEQKTIPLEISDITDRLEKQKTEVKNSEAELKEVKMTVHKKELELKEKEEVIAKYDAQLMQVKTNKEYSALQSEITTIKADNSILEEDIIKLFDEVENAEEMLKKEQSTFDTLEKEYTLKKKELEDKIKYNENRIKELEQQKKVMAEGINPHIFDTYERIVNARHGIALAKIEHDNCGVCSMRITAQVINEVMLGKKLVQCESCNRILYLESPTESPT